MSVKSIETHLAKVAFGDQMAMLEAYQKWSYAAQKAGLKIDFCGNCGIPSEKKMDHCQNIDCGRYTCGRSFCNFVVHKCPSGGADRKYCSNDCFTCNEECDNTICINCRRICAFCNGAYCDDHFATLYDIAACIGCIDDISNVKKRKIEK